MNSNLSKFNANNEEWLKKQTLCIAILAMVCPSMSHANPTGAQIINGQVSIDQSIAGITTIKNSPNAIINWQDFSIAKNEITRFVQENGQSAVLNRIIGGNPSEILGSLYSNGNVFLINPNGILFGAGGKIDTQGLIASTLNLDDNSFKQGNFHFLAGSKTGNLTNEGIIHAGKNGNIVLIAPHIENNGLIHSEGGNIVLAAGQELVLTNLDDPDVRFQIQAPENSVLNLGKLLTEGGAINVFAGSLKHSGDISADSVEIDRQGNIRLVTKNTLEVSANSKISANNQMGDGGHITVESTDDTAKIKGTLQAEGAKKGGSIDVLGNDVSLTQNANIKTDGQQDGGNILIGGDYQGKNPLIHNADTTTVDSSVILQANSIDHGKGGNVIVWSNNTTNVAANISAKGGKTGGDGGFVETSGHQLDVTNSKIDASAPKGKNGEWLLDPNDITISESYDSNVTGVTDVTGSTNVTTTNDSALISPTTIVNALDKSTNVTISTQAKGTNSQAGNIYINSSILNTAENDATLTLNAHKDIVMGKNVGISSTSGKLNLALNANRNITGDNNAAINTNSGNISLFAQNGSLSIGKVNNSGNTSLTAGTTINVGSISANQDVMLNAGSNLTLLGSVSTPSNAILSTYGTVTQSANTQLSAKNLMLLGLGDFKLPNTKIETLVAKGVKTIDLTNNDSLTINTVTMGNNTVNGIDANGDVTLATNAGNINISSNIVKPYTSDADTTLLLKAAGSIILDPNTRIDASASRNKLNIVLNANTGTEYGSIQINDSASLFSHGGNIVMGGGVCTSTTPCSIAAKGSLNNFDGIAIKNANIDSNGGLISLNGEGFSGSGISNANGVLIMNSLLNSATGNINISGVGGFGSISNEDGGSGNNGIFITGYDDGTTIKPTMLNTSTGDITLNGTGKGEGQSNIGISTDTTTLVTNGGKITLNGTGANNDAGILLESRSVIGNNTTADVTLNGKNNQLSISTDRFDSIVFANNLPNGISPSIQSTGKLSIDSNDKGIFASTPLALMANEILLQNGVFTASDLSIVGNNQLTKSIQINTPIIADNVSIKTKSGDLGIGSNLVATNLVLHAGENIAAGTASGGNLIFTNNATITSSNAKLYTGALNTFIPALAPSATIYYGADQTTRLPNNGNFIIYRESQPTPSTPPTTPSIDEAQRLAAEAAIKAAADAAAAKAEADRIATQNNNTSIGAIVSSLPSEKVVEFVKLASNLSDKLSSSQQNEGLQVAATLLTQKIFENVSTQEITKVVETVVSTNQEQKTTIIQQMASTSPASNPSNSVAPPQTVTSSKSNAKEEPKEDKKDKKSDVTVASTTTESKTSKPLQQCK